MLLRDALPLAPDNSMTLATIATATTAAATSSAGGAVRRSIVIDDTFALRSIDLIAVALDRVEAGKIRRMVSDMVRTARFIVANRSFRIGTHFRR